MPLRRVLSSLGWSALTLTVASVTNTYRFKTTLQEATLPGLTKPLRVAHLSDLHYGLFVGPLIVKAWVDATLAAKPDLIVITGDFLDGHFRAPGRGTMLRELARLQAPLGVWGVWGNHDWTSLNTNAQRIRFAERLRVNGVQLINNAGVQVRDDVYVAGVDDWWFGAQDLDAALRHYQGGAILLLAHNPDYLPHVPSKVGLTLCGHTHGGQVRLPMIGPLKRSTLMRPLQGWVRGDAIVTSPAEGRAGVEGENHALGFVSRGLGVTGLPVRFACPAEVAILDLHPPDFPF